MRQGAIDCGQPRSKTPRLSNGTEENVTATQGNENVSALRAKIRVVVVDDHPIIREGFTTILNAQPDMTLVGAASNGADALLLIKSQSPDIVLLDLRMPGIPGLEVLAELQRRKERAKVIIMTISESAEHVRRSMSSGARGYLLKDSSKEEILEAIRRVHAGEKYLPNRVLRQLAEGLINEALTPRELEVLQSVAEGKSNKEVAVSLLISEGTVKTHVKSLLEKLGAPSRSAAIREAIHRGLIQVD